MMVSNAKNWRPSKDTCVFNLVTTFTYDFKFITKSGVDFNKITEVREFKEMW
jgi:hypothetical protein